MNMVLLTVFDLHESYIRKRLHNFHGIIVFFIFTGYGYSLVLRENRVSMQDTAYILFLLSEIFCEW